MTPNAKYGALNRRNKKRRFQAADSVRTYCSRFDPQPWRHVQPVHEIAWRTYYSQLGSAVFYSAYSKRKISRMGLPNCLKFGTHTFTYCKFVAAKCYRNPINRAGDISIWIFPNFFGTVCICGATFNKCLIHWPKASLILMELPCWGYCLKHFILQTCCWFAFCKLLKYKLINFEHVFKNEIRWTCAKYFFHTI